VTKRSKRKSRRGRKHANNNNLTWLISGALGLIVLAVAALVLRLGSHGSSGDGQREFDPNFEPEITGVPRVEVVQNEVLDYGNIKLGTTVTTEYTVRNVGDEPLMILGEPRVELVEGC